MTYTQIKKGLTMWYEHIKPKHESMPTIVFIHGWVQNHTGWTRVAKKVHAAGYGTLLLDLPGHGYSSTPQDINNFQLDNLSKSCAALIRKKKLTNFVIVGHSMGGMIAQYLCKYVKARAVILVDTTYTSPMSDLEAHVSAHTQLVAALISSLAKKMRKTRRKRIIDFAKIKNPKEVIVWIHGASTTNARALLACLHSIITIDSTKELKQITVPVLLLVGKNDTRTPPKRMMEMRKILPNAKLVIIPHMGHSINLVAPQLCAREIIAFLSTTLTR